MATLSETCSTEPTRTALVDDCVVLVDAEVSRKKGVSGFAIKGAYSAVKKIKPGFVRAAVDGLFDDFIQRLEPFFASWQRGEESFEAHLGKEPDRVADALLGVTDDRAKVSKHKTAAKLYKKLRPSAKSNVSEAVPKLGQLLDKHLKS